MHRHLTALVLATAGLLLTGCSSGAGTSSDDSDTDTSSGDDTSKYEQTWAKDYSTTTCPEWKTQMSPQQQFAAAADMLTSGRNKGDGGEGLPSDSLISEFQGGITTACVNDTQNIAETAAALYLTERDRFRP